MLFQPDSGFVRDFPRPLLIVDGGLHVLGFSRRALGVLGVRQRGNETQLARRLTECLDAEADLGDRLALTTARLQRPGEEERFVWRHAGREYTVTVTVLEASRPVLLALWEDTTASAVSEAILQDARSYLERLLDDLPLGIVVLGEGLRITSINRRQLDFLQRMGVKLRLEEAIGATLEEALPEALGKSWHQQCSRAVASGAPSREVRAGYPVVEGELVLAALAMPLRGDPAAGTGVMLVAEDITARTRLERELVRAEKLSTVGQMVITVNHEINNPLSIIATNAQMLRMSAPELDDAARGRLARIEDQVQRIAAVTRRLQELDEVATSEYISSGPAMVDLWGSQPGE